MSTSTINKQNTSSNAVISNQEITSRKWKFDSLFKLIAGIIYGFFFGMLPSTFVFNEFMKSEGEGKFVNVPIYEITAVVSLLIIGVFSMILLFWVFKGDVKRKHQGAYWASHIINGILLSIGISIVSFVEKWSSSEEINRYLVLAISYVIWAVGLIATLTIIMSLYKKQYPLSWARVPFVIVSLIFSGLTHLFTYLSAKAALQQDNFNDQVILFSVLAIVSFLVGIIIFGFAIAYIKRFKDVLLGERTEYEINTIRDWESARIFALVMSSALIVTYSIILVMNNSNSIDFKYIPLFVEIAIDLLLVVPYIIIITYIKLNNVKNSNKGFLVSRIFKTIDNGLLLDVFAWIIIVKSTIIQGLSIGNSGASDNIKGLMLVISFISVAILYGFTTIIQVNVPNLRNTAITIPTIVCGILLGLFAILFGGYLYNIGIGISPLVFILMPVFLLLGSSISLVIKIFIIGKIFKSEWKREENVDKSYLFAMQNEQKNDFIGERTEEVDVEKLRKSAEDTNKNAEEFKKAVNESVVS